MIKNRFSDDELNKAISIISIAFCSIGISIIGNIISLTICLRKELPKVPKFVFMAFQSAINILKLATIIACILILKI